MTTREVDKKLFKKCIKCRCWRPREDIADPTDGHIQKRQFGLHDTSSDGLQSICYSCKNIANTAARGKNATQRIRHHTGTRCLTQLGAKAPPKFVANLEDYLGYKITKLVKHLGKDLKEREHGKRKLRDALNEGYHIDHIRPLSSFKVVYRDQQGVEHVDWDVFRECWDVSNLRAIPAEENLAKGAQYDAESPRKEETQEESNEEVSEEVASSGDSP